MTYEIRLDIFEGPIDLLLYLIKKNEIDIYNIPIVLITNQYLNYLEIIQSLNLDLAGEYLVLASTLIHIKSKMLLPLEDDGINKEEDPRANLVQQLLNYQSYKQAADNLDSRLLLERDVFKKGNSLYDNEEVENEDTSIELSLFDLLEAYRKIIIQTDGTRLLEIDGEKMSLAERINEIMEKLIKEGNMTFSDLLAGYRDQQVIIYTFLAVLELIKMGFVTAHQSEIFGTIRVFSVVKEAFENLKEQIQIS